MNDLTRIAISLDKKLMDKFDKSMEDKGYTNRSEAIRDLIRDSLVEKEWQADEEVVGTITLVYNHHTRELPDTLNDIQHNSFHAIVSNLHVHLDEHNCLEVMIVRGKSSEVRKIADKMIGTRGVVHGKLTMATTGRGLL
ncbi:MAG TPA: nickel-responsive transcriptional regulator NikR [Nitrospirota bacterium]|jgi:CopG family nickel-responsive transcriptional regulator